jgi:hypothetical protein
MASMRKRDQKMAEKQKFAHQSFKEFFMPRGKIKALDLRTVFFLKKEVLGRKKPR